MTPDYHLAFCKQCTHRKFEKSQGIICSLTNRKPDFHKNCSNYNQDEALKFKTAEESLQRDERYYYGLIAGIGTGILGALLWAFITVNLMIQFAFMAIAVGASVGYAIKYAGRGTSLKFQTTGALIAFASCILGNVFSIIGLISKYQDVSIVDVLFYLDYSIIPVLLKEEFNMIDLVFYLLAILEGFKFSITSNDTSNARTRRSFLNHR